MKVNELLESPDPTQTIMSAIGAAMVRGSIILGMDIASDEMSFDISYEFPEHRTGVVPAVKKILKGLATVSAEKSGQYGQFVLSFNFDIKTPIDIHAVRTALVAKYKDEVEFTQGVYIPTLHSDPAIQAVLAAKIADK